MRRRTRNSRFRRSTIANSAPAWLVWSLVLALAGVGLAAREALAQRPRTALQRRALVAATEDRLWTARVEEERTYLSYRDRTGQSVAAEPLNARLTALAAAGRQAYAFQEDGSFYRYADEWAPAINLPRRQMPVDLNALDGIPYALLSSEVAAELPAHAAATSAAAGEEPAAAALVLARYDQPGWSVVAPCPPEVVSGQSPELRPRLCGAFGRLLLFSHSLEANRLEYWTFEAATAQWTPGPPLAVAPDLRGYWPAFVNRLPTLVLHVTDAGAEDAQDGGSAGTALRFFRLVVDDGDNAWQPASLKLSPLPEAASGTPSPVDACGFNQHLGVQEEMPEGSSYLRFGRFEGAAALDTIDLLAKPRQTLLPAALQVLRAAVLLGILAALFIFRRNSLATAFPLPRDQAPAFVLQRLAATLIDLVPFTVIASLLLGMNWARALDEVATTTFEPRAGQELPTALIVAWTFLSAGMYVIYCTTMELLAGRTLGKMLLGLRVVGEGGVRAPAWRIIVRNLFRLVEVLPPFWILAFVMLLSRSRQRVGDVFAGTLVVRQIAVQNDSESAAEE